MAAFANESGPDHLRAPGSSLTVSLWRPWARRLAKTALPAAVLMRSRKPCLLARLRLLG